MTVTARMKAFACVLASASLLVAAGCGSDDNGSTTSTAANGGIGNGKLTISAWDTGAPNDPIDVAVKDFEKANPGVDVTLNKTAYGQFEQALGRQLSTGQAPDVARMLLGYGDASTARSLADKGLLTDLSDASWVGDIPPASAVTTNKGDKTYAFPVDSTAIGILYDPAVLAKAGAKLPQTFPEVLALCRTQADTGTPAFALGAAQGSAMPLFITFGLAASTLGSTEPDFGQQRLDDATTFADSAGWKAAIDEFTDMKDAGCFDKNAAGISQDAASAAFAQGKALMTVAPNVVLPLFLAANPKAQLQMAPLPGTDDAADEHVAFGPVSGLGIPSKAKNPALARKFVDFYAENHVKYSKIDDSIPSIPEHAGAAKLPAYATALAPLVSDGKTVTIMDALWPNPDVATQFATGLVKILLGQGSTADTLGAMDEAWTPEPPK